MVVPFLIVAPIGVSLLVLFGVCLLVVKLGHPDDKNSAYFPRGVVVFGLWLSFASILVLPYDVAASSFSDGGGISMSTLWLIVYITLAVMVVAVIPYAFFYYENDVDEDDVEAAGLGFFDSQAGMALKYTVITLVVFIVIFVIMYSLLNDAIVPVLRVAQSRTLVFANTASILRFPNLGTSCDTVLPGQTVDASALCESGGFDWIIPVSLPLYIVAFMAFVGWFFFTLFVGVGLFALPLDLIQAYRTRPKPISTRVYMEQRALLGERCKQMLQIGERLQQQFDLSHHKKSKSWSQRSDLNAFQKSYFVLKKDYQILVVAHRLRGGNPLWYLFLLLCGLVGLGLSCCWFVHIAIYILPAKPYSPFLNTFFLKFGDYGVFPFAVFSFYLIWCVVKGNFRLGVRFLFWKIYPMELENTLLNAMLLNTLIILLCSLPTVQFCVIAFPVYTASTQASIMFGNQIQYLEGFRVFFMNNVFIILILAVSLLTFLVVSLYPENKAASIEAQLDRLAKSKNVSLHDYQDELKYDS